jgi:CheY-like chemotaxis protein
MDLNNVISSIPNVVGSLYENIFVVSRNLGIYYEVQYNGEQLKISAPKTYDELIEYSDTYKDDLVSVIENNDSLKEVFVNKDNQEKLISVVTKDQYKLVFVMDISKIRVDSGERKLLIIADDSPVITKFFKKTLEADYDVMVASNGKEAIELVEQYKDKNLVGLFCDLMMPEMDGYQVLEYFKEHELFDKVPVSIISGEDTQDGIEKATSYGVVDMLQKPFNADNAKAIVERTVSFSPNL